MKKLSFILCAAVVLTVVGNVAGLQKNSVAALFDMYGLDADSASAMKIAGYALALYNSGDFAGAVEAGRRALDSIEAVYGMNSPYYTSELSNLAYYEYSMGDTTGAVDKLEKVLSIYDRNIGKDNELYADISFVIALLKAKSGNFKEALKHNCDARSFYKKRCDADSVRIYHTILNNTFLWELKAGDYYSAIETGKELLQADGTIEDANRLMVYAMMSQALCMAGDYEQSLIYNKDALDIYELLNYCDFHIYSGLLYGRASCCLMAGDYPIARECFYKRLDFLKKNGDPYYYAEALADAALFNLSFGNFPEAVKLGEEALAVGGENKVFNGISPYSIIARAEASLGNYGRALELENKACHAIAESKGRIDADYLACFIRVAYLYACKGDMDDARAALWKASRMIDDVSIINKDASSVILNDLAMCYFQLGYYEEANALSVKNYGIVKEIYGEDSRMCINAMSLLAVTGALLGEDAEVWTKNVSYETEKMVLSSFLNLTSKERRDFWLLHKRWYEVWLPMVVNIVRSDSLICSMYDGALLSKGILLNSEMEMRDLLLESGDTAVVSLYEQMRINRSMAYRQREDLAGLAAMDDSVRMAVRQRADSLERVADRQERELVERSKVFGDYMRNLSISWRDVQKMLGKDEIAIEFLEVPVADDSVVYAALTLKYDYDCPHFIELFDGRMLTELDKSLYFSSPALYDMVWKPIEKEMENVRAVYFSPAGELHRIAVEYAPVADGEFICGKYDLYRLSSTRQLVAYTGIAETVRDGNTAVLYGGLDYEAAPSDIVADGNRHAGKSERGIHDFYPAIPADSLIARGPVVSLPATRLEVDSINSIMKNSHWDVRTFTGSLGTEASFKALSGQLKSVIHVATHGFYGKDDRENIIMPEIFSYGNRYVEDKAMARSGLLFAGAANAWQMPDTVDNGILTAQEVSALDLRGLDLCVLSACETGLGEISGDGVFGLQRGFKKAGAKTLLISLNRVYDEATGLLMTEFYRNYLSGMSKVESLKSAQQYLRDYERTVTNSAANAAVFISKSRQQAMGRKKVKPFTDPVYWAQFILVDAL